MKSQSVFLTVLMAFVMSACAFPNGQGDDEQQRKLIQEQKQQLDQVAPIQGYWTGPLTRGNERIELGLQITVLPVVSGRTANGRAIFRYDANGVLNSLSDPRYNSVNLSGDFQYETGALTLSTATPTSGSVDPSMSQGGSAGAQVGSSPGSADYPRIVQLTYDPATQTLRGPLVTRSGQTVGNVVLRRTERPTGETDQDQEEVYYQRLREQYQPITGDFYGPVKDNGTSRVLFNLCLTISVTNQASPDTGHLRPVLQAVYTRSDISDPNLRRVLAANYSFSVTPRTIRMTNGSQGGPANTGYTVDLSGEFSDRKGRSTLNEIHGIHNNVSRGELGQFDVRRVSKCPAPPQVHEVPPIQTSPIMVNPGDVLDRGKVKPPRRGRRRH